MNTLPVTFALVSAPSNSKGWGRYSSTDAGIRSSTGNEWLYAGSAGEVSGEEFTVITQTSNRSKSGQTTLDTTTWTMRAEPGATADLDHRGCPQGMVVRVTGAVVVSFSRVRRD